MVKSVDEVESNLIYVIFHCQPLIPSEVLQFNGEGFYISYPLNNSPSTGSRTFLPALFPPLIVPSHHSESTQADNY